MTGGFEAWVGRARTATDTLDLERARKLAATLDLDPEAFAPGGALPRGWHWIYFHEPVPRSGLAEDGHERRGDFLPPVPLARRMWAGGRLTFHRELTIGAQVRRTSTVRSIDLKEGRSGRLAFVTVEHRLEADDGATLIEEEQDIVYAERSRWTPPSPRPGADAAHPTGIRPEATDARRLGTFTADEVTLFRFSALTFNGHRIHFDRAFAREVEGYPDLVVHGPLLALLLLGAGDRRMRELNEAGATGPVRFSYRAVQPVFCGEGVELWGASGSPDGGALDLWVEHPERGVVTRADLGCG